MSDLETCNSRRDLEYDPIYHDLNHADRARNDDDESSVDSCLDLINFKSIFDKNQCLETGISFSFSGSRTLHISTLLDEQDIAPLFSGAEWAGTRVWHAAVRAIEYMYVDNGNWHSSCKNMIYECLNNKTNNESTKANVKANRKNVLELGCGLGVPGMIACLMGAKVVLTDQESLLQQLEKNIEQNFDKNDIESKLIQAITLDWSRKNIQELLNKCGLDNGFDVVVNCDCVFEPLYGESWKFLVDAIDELLFVNPKCLVLSSVERRNGDGIEKFLAAQEVSKNISHVELVHKDEKNNIELYVTHGRTQ